MTAKEPTYEELKARLAKVEAELSALKERAREARTQLRYTEDWDDLSPYPLSAAIALLADR